MDSTRELTLRQTVQFQQDDPQSIEDQELAPEFSPIDFSIIGRLARFLEFSSVE
jgi:hypothetical protein